MRATIDARLPSKEAWQLSEHHAQVKLFQQLSILSNECPELDLAFAVPNGDLRHPVIARKLAAEGVRAGVPDVFLPVPRGGFHGAWIEMKKAGGAVKDHQWRWLEALHSQGYFVRVCNHPATAAKILYDYVSQPTQQP